MGGVGFQQFFVLVFLYIAFRFQQQVKRENPARLSQALLLLYAEYAVLILITVGASFSRDPPGGNLSTNNAVLGQNHLPSDRIRARPRQLDPKS